MQGRCMARVAIWLRTVSRLLSKRWADVSCQKATFAEVQKQMNMPKMNPMDAQRSFMIRFVAEVVCFGFCFFKLRWWYWMPAWSTKGTLTPIDTRLIRMHKVRSVSSPWRTSDFKKPWGYYEGVFALLLCRVAGPTLPFGIWDAPSNHRKCACSCSEKW